MTNKEAIKLIQEIEEDGRNVTFEHIKALYISIMALEFVEEFYPISFNDYREGEEK
jgi:hypothetical protein